MPDADDYDVEELRALLRGGTASPSPAAATARSGAKPPVKSAAPAAKPGASGAKAARSAQATPAKTRAARGARPKSRGAR